MALKFNPFEKDKPVAAPVAGTRFSKLRVFDDPTQSTPAPGAHKEEIGPDASPSSPVTPVSVLEEHRQGPEEKWEQSGSKVGAKWEQKWEQSGSKVGAKWEQEKLPESKVGAKWEQSGSKSGSKVGAKVGAKWEQSGSKIDTDSSISSVTGLQREALLFIAENCHASRSNMSQPVNLDQVSKHLKTTANTAKNAIKRLVKKGFLQRVSFKDGRGGWSQYALPNVLYQEVLQMEFGRKVGAKWEQKWEQSGSKSGSKVGASASCSSSSKTTTTTPSSSAWSIDLERSISDKLLSLCERCGLVDLFIGPNDLMQIWRKGLFATEQDFLDSVAHIAFYVTSDAAKGLTSPKAWVIATLLKGYYAPPASFKTWDELQAEAKLETTRQRLSQLRIFKREQFDMEFEIWFLEQSPDKLKKLMPPMSDSPESPAAKATMRQVFAKESGREIPEKA